jgi:hypothetical protein
LLHCFFANKAPLRDGKRFVVHADEKLTAFVELESVIRTYGKLVLQVGEIFAKLGLA